MKQAILSLLSRTPVHVGAGNSVGAIDSPIMRERHTRIPILPGSALKGVLADLWPVLPEDERKKIKRDDWPENTKEHLRLFGEMDQAGRLLIGEARTLAFPLRSAKGAFAWITCPLALNRFKRDAGREFPIPTLPDTMSCFAGNAVLFEGKYAVLEEYVLNQITNGDIKKISDALKDLSDDPVWEELAEHLVIISDEMYSYFVENACEVVTRIRIDDEKGTVADGALFNQEQLPSETLLYTTIGVRDEKTDDLQTLKDRISLDGNLLQIGGDETIGLGYCSVKMI